MTKRLKNKINKQCGLNRLHLQKLSEQQIQNGHQYTSESLKLVINKHNDLLEKKH